MATTPTTRQIIIGIALAAFAFLLWTNRSVIVLALGSVVFATLLRALADPLARVTGISPRWSVVIVVFGLAVTLGALFWLFGAQIGDQLAQLRKQLPEGLRNVQEWLNRTPGGSSLVDAIKETPKDGVVSKFGIAAGALLGGLGNVLLIIFAGLYFALDPTLYRRGLLRLLPINQRSKVDRALGQTGDALRRWLVAQVILMGAVGTLTGIGLALIGVPLAFSLAVVIGILEFIPLIGPILGGIPGVLLAFTKGPAVALWAVLVYVAVQQIESNLLTPLVQRWAVELPPVIALLSIVICGVTFGPVGVVFATPLAVIAMSLIRHLYVEDTLEKPSQ